MSDTFTLQLIQSAQHVNIAPGSEIILRGSYTSTHNGAVIDAATTTWPVEAPGGGSLDPSGLIDFAGGGFHVTSRDPQAHVVHAVATGEDAPACALVGVQAPCLPLRISQQALPQLLTPAQWRDSLKGAIQVEIPAPPLVAVAPSMVPYLWGTAAIVGIGLLATAGVLLKRRQAMSPTGQLLALANRVRAKLTQADAVVSAPLMPAIDAALKALKGRRVDATSKEGQRVATVLRRVELRIDESAAQVKAEEEQAAADELVREVESALEAADEVGMREKG